MSGSWSEEEEMTEETPAGYPDAIVRASVVAADPPSPLTDTAPVDDEEQDAELPDADADQEDADPKNEEAPE